MHRIGPAAGGRPLTVFGEARDGPARERVQAVGVGAREGSHALNNNTVEEVRRIPEDGLVMGCMGWRRF